MNTHVFASLAQVRILLLPVGSISQSSFEKYSAEIRSFEEIRLGDIPADNKDERARFMPNPLSAGYLHLSFPRHPPPLSHIPLSLIRPSHFPLAVIGIATSSQTDALSSILAQFDSLLVGLFPPGCMYPLARNCFVFEDGAANANLNLGNSLSGLIVIPSLMGNRKLYIGTLLADLCSHILGEFGVVVQALESPLGNEYLNSSLMPTLPPLSEIPTSLDMTTKRDSLPQIPAHQSQPEIGKTTVSHTTGPYLKRNMSSNATQRQSTLGVPAPKKRLSGIGAASSHSRLFKVLGDFFLLAGRTEDALVWYAEAIALFKSPTDTIWHASALEGMATISVLDAWSTGHGLHTSTSTTTKEPWADISDKLTQAIAIYYKLPPGDAENYSLLAYLYCSAVLRQTSLLFAIWSSKGWGPLAFTAMLQPGPTPYLPPTLAHEDPNGWINVERLSSISGIARQSISTVLGQVHGPWLLHLDAGERVGVLETMSSLYSCLGYKRKEAYILREVLGCILDLLVCGREEEGNSTDTGGSTGLGISVQNATGSQNGTKGGVGVRLNESNEGNESILRMLKYACKVLGVNLDAVRLIDVPLNSTVPETLQAVPDDNEGLANEESHGWPELQVGVVREAVAVAEALPDYPTVAQFSLSALKVLRNVLSPADQYHLYSTASRALATARRRGDAKYVEYWSGRPIVSLSIAPLPFVRIPREKPLSVLDIQSSEINSILPGAKDPFLYNPRKAVSGQEKPLVVQNESLEFQLMLQNPYIFDLELQSLALSTSGVAFDSQPIQVVIPSTSYHIVTLTGKAVETGTLVIRGCFVRAPGGAMREFILPMSTDEDEERLSRRRSALACEVGRSKYSGLESLSWGKSQKRSSAESALMPSKPRRYLECVVVPEQPLLRIRRTSLTHGAVMLYNGETSTIRITLENVSFLPIDFIRLAFDDSTIVPAEQALAEGNLSEFETYETEYDLIHRPTFSWTKEKDTEEIAPGQKVTIAVSCFGKVGCTSGTVHVSYSYIHRPANTLHTLSAEVFHTRQLSYPVMVTVYHMLECHDMDILPLASFPASDVQDEDNDVHTQFKKSILSVEDQTGWCLFSVEVRNTYGLPFDISFERNQDETPYAINSCTVAPGSTSRIVIPIKKFLLSEEQVSRPIPTLSNRQFVVTKTNLTSQEEKARRELFWYREELFRCVRGRWRETGGTRAGDLSLRQQRLTLPMLETLRTETVRVLMTLIEYNTSGPDTVEREVDQKYGKYYPKPNDFVYLRTTVKNLSPSPLVLIIDLDMDPMGHVISEGVLTDQPVGVLGSEDSTEVETALCFLSNGSFTISAQVRTLETRDGISSVGSGQLTAVVRESICTGL